MLKFHFKATFSFNDICCVSTFFFNQLFSKIWHDRLWLWVARRAAPAGSTQSLVCFPTLAAGTNNAEQKRNFTHSFQYWRGSVSIMETWEQKGKVPGCHSDGLTRALSFSGEISCPVAKKLRSESEVCREPIVWGQCHSDSITLCNLRVALEAAATQAPPL